MFTLVTAVVVNDQGALQLQRRTDNELWGLPGGAMNIGESFAQAVVREVKEETRLAVEPTGIVGVSSDADHGEVRQEFWMCLTARIVGDHESTEMRFVEPRELDGLPTASTRLRIQHVLGQRTMPHVA
ncbi:MAG: NUDIX domain-containing protein [Chloroflexi bacterium]|nr:NUDIX domain-containing protein [Chloroflexota bacterium]